MNSSSLARYGASKAQHLPVAAWGSQALTMARARETVGNTSKKLDAVRAAAPRLPHCDPHIVACGSIVRMDDAELGPLALVQPSQKLSQTPGTIRSLGPKLAQHNQEIFGDLLGLGCSEMTELRNQNIL